MADENTGVQQTVEFENDRVRVVRFRFSPHARVPMHRAPDVVTVALTEGHLKLTFPNGQSQEHIYKAGETGWAPAQQHQGENTGDSPFEFVAVQLKAGAGGDIHAHR